MARPWRRAMINLAIKFGRLPHEFLAATDSVELTELLAFFKLQAEEEAQPPDVEESWRSLLSKPIHD